MRIRNTIIISSSSSSSSYVLAVIAPPPSKATSRKYVTNDPSRQVEVDPGEAARAARGGHGGMYSIGMIVEVVVVDVAVDRAVLQIAERHRRHRCGGGRGRIDRPYSYSYPSSSSPSPSRYGATPEGRRRSHCVGDMSPIAIPPSHPSSSFSPFVARLSNRRRRRR